VRDARAILGSLVVVDDTAAAGWIVSALRPFASGVGALVPPIFEEYVRVLHPAYALSEEGQEQPVRWGAIAGENGCLVHPLVQFPHLVGRIDFQNGPRGEACWDVAPAEGTLPAGLVPPLVSVLARHTSTPDRCWFAVWDGFADSLVRDRTAARLRIPCRELVLLTGPLGGIGTSFGEIEFQSANLWWPEDRAWCVATEIDLVSTYVGGTRACVAGLLARPDLEVLPAGVDDPVGYGADQVNPPPPGLFP
jgi:hypothetical protein